MQELTDKEMYKLGQEFTELIKKWTGFKGLIQKAQLTLDTDNRPKVKIEAYL